MRKILFKAKRIDNAEWVYWNVYGELCRESGKRARLSTKNGATTSYYDYIHQVYQMIDINTICQYTGLVDKNGNKIWENDVVKFEDCEMSTESGYGDCFVNVGKIAYDTDTMSYFITDRITVDMNDIDIKNEVEVIGNVFDNPELIGE